MYVATVYNNFYNHGNDLTDYLRLNNRAFQNSVYLILLLFTYLFIYLWF